MATKQIEKTTPQKSGSIAEAKGKLGVMMPGMGAVATTFVAGVEAVRKASLAIGFTSGPSLPYIAASDELGARRLDLRP